MREKLEQIKKYQLRFRAIVSRFSTKTNFKGETEKTVMLDSIKRLDTDELVADHVWLPLSISLSQLNLTPGKIIDFNAKIESYKKGYVNLKRGIDNRKIDYKLSQLTKLNVIN